MARIVKLKTENVMRVSLVEVTPEGNLVIVGGKNGAGKSSVLTSIAAALGGADFIPDVPIRAGQERAEINIELDNLLVRRTFTPKGSYLTVTTKDGMRAQNPQEVLDKLVGKLSYDPMAFLLDKNQGETLRKIAGLDFTEWAKARIDRYAERTMVNRELTKANAALNTMTLYGDVPAEPVELASILKEQREAADKNAANANQRREAQEIVRDRDNAIERINKCQKEIESLERQLASVREIKATLETALADLRVRDQKASEVLAGLKDEDLSKFTEMLHRAQNLNARINANAARAKAVVLRDGLQIKVETLTREIETLDAAKEKRLREAAYPVEGLTLSADGAVLFKGIPLNQCSTRDQLLVSTAIGAALNPKLRIMLIRRGNDLDSDGLKALNDWAEKNDFQIWLERVSENEKPTVLIEDGHVAGEAVSNEATP